MKNSRGAMALASVLAITTLAGCGSGPNVELLLPAAAPTISDSTFATARDALIWLQHSQPDEQHVMTAGECKDDYPRVVAHQAQAGEHVPTLASWLQWCA